MLYALLTIYRAQSVLHYGMFQVAAVVPYRNFIPAKAKLLPQKRNQLQGIYAPCGELLRRREFCHILVFLKIDACILDC